MKLLGLKLAGVGKGSSLRKVQINRWNVKSLNSKRNILLVSLSDPILSYWVLAVPPALEPG